MNDPSRVEPETARHILVDMSVGVEQARQHQFAPDVDDLVRGTRENAVLDCGDHDSAHAYVLSAIDPRRRTHDPATQDEIEGCCPFGADAPIPPAAVAAR